MLCSKLETLTLLGSASFEIKLETLNLINKSFPLLKDLTVSIHYSTAKKSRYRYADKAAIEWGSKLESVAITTDGDKFEFNAPVNLQSFSITVVPEKDSRYRRPETVITNIKEIFSSRLKSIELLEHHCDSTIIKALQEHSPDIEVRTNN